MATGEEGASDESRIHAMIADACLGRASDADFTRDLRAFLGARGLDEPDVEAIVGAPPRLALYRRLIRNNLTGVTEKMLARTRARLNDRDDAFDASFAAFLAERGPRTHYLRDVPREFLEWVEPRWRAQGDIPLWAIDLARYELLEYEIAAASARTGTPDVTDVALDRPLVLREPLRLVRYAFAVHELPGDLDDRTAPTERATTLLAQRDTEHAVHFLELTPLAAAIMARLIDHATLGDAVSGGCADVGTVTSDVVVAYVARLLADLGERGILLGGLP